MPQIVNQHDIDQLIHTDKVFIFIHNKYGPPPNWSRPEGFVSLSKIILEQQVSLASANAHFNKLNTYLPAFTPGNILTLTDKEMHQCHISRQKASYLRALSLAIINNDINLDELSGMHKSNIRKRLTKIKGIGDWTADVYLMFCLQSKDIFPAGDIAIVKTVKELTKAKTKEEIILLSENWKPLRSLAAYFLWHYYLINRGRKSTV